MSAGDFGRGVSTAREHLITEGLQAAAWGDQIWVAIRGQMVNRVLDELRQAEGLEGLLAAKMLLRAVDEIEAMIRSQVRAGERERSKLVREGERRP